MGAALVNAPPGRCRGPEAAAPWGPASILCVGCLSRVSALVVCLGWLCGGVSNRHGFHWVPLGSWALLRADSAGRAGGIEVYGPLELKESWKAINLNSLAL